MYTLQIAFFKLLYFCFSILTLVSLSIYVLHIYFSALYYCSFFFWLFCCNKWIFPGVGSINSYYLISSQNKNFNFNSIYQPLESILITAFCWGKPIVFLFFKHFSLKKFTKQTESLSLEIDPSLLTEVIMPFEPGAAIRAKQDNCTPVYRPTLYTQQNK